MASNSMVALGCAPHSGWAAVVAVGEVDGHLQVLARERVELADPHSPESRQPYHAVEGLPVAEAATRLTAWEASSGAMAREAIKAIGGRLATGGHRLSGVGILDSAGRRASTLAATLASHALIHTADGDHFRAALAFGAEECGLPLIRVRARELEEKAVAALGKRAGILRAEVQRLGREVGSPWTADQKAAALLGWMVLVELQ